MILKYLRLRLSDSVVLANSVGRRALHGPRPYCRFRSVAAAAAAAGGTAGAGAALLLPAPNSRRVGLRSRLFTARLISPRVRRPSAIRRPDRLSKSSASSRIDFTA